MIIHLKDSVGAGEARELAEKIKAFYIQSEGKNVLITGSGTKELPGEITGKEDEFWVFPNDMQLSSRQYRQETREVKNRRCYDRRNYKKYIDDRRTLFCGIGRADHNIIRNVG